MINRPSEMSSLILKLTWRAKPNTEAEYYLNKLKEEFPYWFKMPKGYWTLERCIEKARKFKTRSEWYKNSSGSYRVACENNWFDICCNHMDEIKKSNGYWTLEKCKEKGREYKSRVEWLKNSPSSYQTALKYNWLDMCCGHMEEIKKPNGYWTLERCIEDAKKYKTKKEWKKNSYSSYQTALRNNWLDKCCRHMDKIRKSNGYWTLEKCKEDAKKYKTRTEWRKNSGGYYAAYYNNWLDMCCEHMIEIQKPRGYWTLERCIEKGRDYKSKAEWKKNSPCSYQAACKNNWLDMCCEHMIEIQKSKGYWTLEKCIEDARKYKSRTEWQKNSGGYYAALRNNWLGICCEHMSKK